MQPNQAEVNVMLDQVLKFVSIDDLIAGAIGRA